MTIYVAHFFPPLTAGSRGYNTYVRAGTRRKRSMSYRRRYDWPDRWKQTSNGGTIIIIIIIMRHDDLIMIDDND